MTIVLTGAGSGGHITPVLAVARELKRRQPKAKLVYIGQKGDKLGDIPANDPHIDAVYTVRAGKFRRYHGEGWKQLLDIPTFLKNVRDFFYVIIGLHQSWRLLRGLHPNAIFIKGGFVGVPVGLAAAKLHIPYVTHDSDALPGLANRIIARWAAKHAVAMPAELYRYPADKTVTTGIPLRKEFVPVDDRLRQQYRKEIGVPADARMLFAVGGGLGARNVNLALADALPHLMREFRDLYVVHAVGRANEGEMQILYDERLTEAERSRLQVCGFIDDVYKYSGAADVVVTRAGATNLAEFALQGKACLVIPSAWLTGGHQLKNAQYLMDKEAALVLREEDLTADPHRLAKQVSNLLKNEAQIEKLGTNLARFAKPNATQELAKLIVEQA